MSTAHATTVKPAYKHRGPPTGLVMLNIDYAYSIFTKPWQCALFQVFFEGVLVS